MDGLEQPLLQDPDTGSSADGVSSARAAGPTAIGTYGRRIATPTSAGRMKSLDSLRGLAAFSVLLSHCYAMMPVGITTAPLFGRLTTEWLMTHTPLSLLVGGRHAVILFFVLSGYVLALQLKRSSSSYLQYTCRRVFRIYPAFAAAVLLASLFWLIAEPQPIESLSAWFNTKSWTEAPSTALVARTLMMTGEAKTLGLDNVIWSLVHEMRISLVFPFLFLATLEYPALLLTSTLALHVIATGALYLLTRHAGMGISEQTIAQSLLATGGFVVFFVAGILLAARTDALLAWWSRLSQRGRTGMLAASLLCLVRWHLLMPDLIMGIGAAGLILAVRSGVGARWMEWRPVRFFGDISYSLYLFHLPCLLLVVHLAYEIVGLGISLVCGAALAVAVSAAAFHFVELPMMRLGRRISDGKRFAGRSPAVSPVVE